MIGHCQLNRKADLNKSDVLMNPILVEFENRGYWSKWYMAYNVHHVKELFKAEYPNGTYFMSKKRAY
jgi:hypothetical protein